MYELRHKPQVPKLPFHQIFDHQIVLFLQEVVELLVNMVQLNVHVGGVTLGGGSVNDIAGRALVVHAAADDYTSQPAGNAGARVACGVITVTQ